MTLWGNGRRLCVGGWLLAALLLIGVNGYHLLTLQNAQLVGHSPTIKTLRTQLMAWESALRSPSWPSAEAGLETLPASHRPPVTASSAGAAPPPESEAVEELPARVALPELTGMVTTLDRFGRETYRAVLDGRVYQTADTVGPFTIDAILPDGVILNRDGRQWRLDCPRPAYSTLATP